MSEVTASASILRDSNEGGIAEVKNGDSETIKDEAWIVSTKTRRLAPSFTLSRKDLGADSSRNAESSSIKKKGRQLSFMYRQLFLISKLLIPPF
jgi:hypothetical protein